MKKMKKYLHDTNTKYYIENICHEWFINYLYCWTYSSYIFHKKLNKILQEPDWPFASFLNLKSLYFTCSHLLLFVVPSPVFHCHSLPFVVTHCHSLTLAVTRCCSLCHSLSFVAPVFVIRCHSLYHSLSFDVPLVCLFIKDQTFWFY